MSQVKVTGSIYPNQVNIFGFSSPNSRVELSSSKVFTVTYSDSEGFFVFDRTLLPKEPGELCLRYFDDQQLTSAPVCIAPPPAGNYHTDIGPILLPPTISFDSFTVSGQSIPNQPVQVTIFQSTNRPKLVTSAQAFSLPTITIQADSQGYYSLNLPNSYASDYRFYANSLYQSAPSARSNILNYHLTSQLSILLPLIIIFLLSIISVFLLLNKKRHYYLIQYKFPLSLRV